MFVCFNKFKPAFNINKAANILRIEFKKVAKQGEKSKSEQITQMLINKLRPALNNAMPQKKGALKLKKE